LIRRRSHGACTAEPRLRADGPTVLRRWHGEYGYVGDRNVSSRSGWMSP
jgi:hypothetical protein